jgi:uncharacterized membrane protein
MAMLVALHALAAVAWVGGMFFGYMVLRPAAGPLEPSLRLALWQRVFSRFFPWVWASIAVLLASGYAMLFVQFGGVNGAGPHIHVMQATGILMMLLFVHLPVFPGRGGRAVRQRRSFAQSDAPHRRDQSRARAHHDRRRRERPLLGVTARATSCGRS